MPLTALRLRGEPFLADRLDIGCIHLCPAPWLHLAALDRSGLLDAGYKLVKVALIHVRYSFTSQSLVLNQSQILYHNVPSDLESFAFKEVGSHLH